WKMTGKYGIPYFSNFVNSDMSPEDARSMCCRLRLDNRELRKRGGGLFGANPLTGSIGVVTINLPRIGYLSETRQDFLDQLDQLIQIAADSLAIKRKILESFTKGDLYPYSRFYLRSIKENTGKFWTNHFSTIGVLGMNEACLNFLEKDITTPEGQAFAVEVMDHIRGKIEQLQEETGEIFNLEATPGEGTTYRFAKSDKEKYSDIICANEEGFRRGDAPFYTNSTHLPVNYTDDMFEALELQDNLQTKYTGGTVQHLFLGEEVTDVNTVKKVVNTVSSSFHLPYFTLTPTFSICPAHGYLSGECPTCSHCGETTEVYSRVVGYLRPVSQWNNGKQVEFDLRKTYTAA
ncbi:MAG: ribonucleoside triphosphate reductase, partial [Desulfobacterales bacterium]